MINDLCRKSDMVTRGFHSIKYLMYTYVVTLIFQLLPSNGSLTRPNCWWKVPQTELVLWRVPQAVTKSGIRI